MCSLETSLETSVKSYGFLRMMNHPEQEEEEPIWFDNPHKAYPLLKRSILPSLP